MKIILTLTFVLAAFVAGAQTLPATDTLLWKVSGFRNLVTEENVTYSSEFVSKPDKVVWSQNEGQTVDNFIVTSIDGTWADTALDGSVTFHVTWGDYPGTMLFQRSDGVSTITLNIPKEGVNMAPFEFVVSEISKN